MKKKRCSNRRREKKQTFFAKPRIQDDKYFSHILRRSWGVGRTQGKCLGDSRRDLLITLDSHDKPDQKNHSE